MDFPIMSVDPTPESMYALNSTYFTPDEEFSNWFLNGMDPNNICPDIETEYGVCLQITWQNYWLLTKCLKLIKEKHTNALYCQMMSSDEIFSDIMTLFKYLFPLVDGFYLNNKMIIFKRFCLENYDVIKIIKRASPYFDRKMQEYVTNLNNSTNGNIQHRYNKVLRSIMSYEHPN